MPEVQMAWSDLAEGQRVRFLTPRFLKLGTVVAKGKSRSLKIQFDGEPRPTVLPDARWYWAQGKVPSAEESLVAWVGEIDPVPERGPDLDADDLMPVSQACELFGVKPKDLRRWLRSGKVAGGQRQGLWLVDAGSLGRHLSERR